MVAFLCSAVVAQVAIERPWYLVAVALPVCTQPVVRVVIFIIDCNDTMDRVTMSDACCGTFDLWSRNHSGVFIIISRRGVTCNSPAHVFTTGKNCVHTAHNHVQICCCEVTIFRRVIVRDIYRWRDVCWKLVRYLGLFVVVCICTNLLATRLQLWSTGRETEQPYCNCASKFCAKLGFKNADHWAIKMSMTGYIIERSTERLPDWATIYINSECIGNTSYYQ